MNRIRDSPDKRKELIIRINKPFRKLSNKVKYEYPRG